MNCNNWLNRSFLKTYDKRWYVNLPFRLMWILLIFSPFWISILIILILKYYVVL